MSAVLEVWGYYCKWEDKAYRQLTIAIPIEALKFIIPNTSFLKW